MWLQHILSRAFVMFARAKWHVTFCTAELLLLAESFGSFEIL